MSCPIFHGIPWKGTLGHIVQHQDYYTFTKKSSLSAFWKLYLNRKLIQLILFYGEAFQYTYIYLTNIITFSFQIFQINDI